VSNARIMAAELIGTMVLILGGPGSAVIAVGLANGGGIGILGVALAFGLSLLVMAYAIGPISGCHINPAVTIGAVLARRISPALVPFYLVGQFLGAAAGAGILFAIATGNDRTGIWAANGWGDKIGSAYGLGPTIVVEIVFTALLVFVVLLTTSRLAAPGFAGIAIGLTLALIHLATIPVDNTSVNPARSFASALLHGTDAWSQFWAFVVFPTVGAVVGVVIWLVVSEERLEDTMLYGTGTRRARDVAARASTEVTDRL
jgi:aquaporin Z